MGKLATLCLLSFSALTAGDLSGIWIGQVPTRNGEFQEIAFKFTQSGNKLGGKLYGDYKSTPIIEGKVSGEEIQFVVLAQEQAGNQINDSRLRFAGTIKDGEIELSRERESSTNAGNGGGVQMRANATRQTFRLKRLL